MRLRPVKYKQHALVFRQEFNEHEPFFRLFRRVRHADMQYKELEASRGVQQALADFHRAGKYLCAICASPTILGRAGYLKGKNYTCFTCMNEDFGGHFTNAYATTDGKLITGKSAAATPEFALAIITALLGPQAAEKTKKEIYYQEYK